MENDSKLPEIKVTRLGGLNLRSGRHALGQGEADRVFGLYPAQNFMMERIPGKLMYRYLDGKKIISLRQTFDGSGNIIVQTDVDLQLIPLDEFLNRATSVSLTPTGGAAEEAMSYALYLHQQNNGVDGGDLAAAGADNVFAKGTINVEATDTAGIGTLASNEITLGSGIYRIRALVSFGGTTADGYSLDARAYLYNVTDAAVVTDINSSTQIVGHDCTGFISGSSQAFNTHILLSGRFQIGASKAFAIYMAATPSTGTWYNETTAQGAPSSGITDGTYPEVYKIIEILKE
jgi:hypothetical protein